LKEPFSPAALPTPIGKAAYEARFARLVDSIVVDDEDPHTHEIAEAFSVARHWVEAGNYLAAMQAIRGLELTTSKATSASPVPTAGDVEQALGDLRRSVERARGGEGAVQAAALWRAAREEVIAGAWEAALALIAEGNGWLSTVE